MRRLLLALLILPSLAWADYISVVQGNTPPPCHWFHLSEGIGVAVDNQGNGCTQSSGTYTNTTAVGAGIPGNTTTGVGSLSLGGTGYVAAGNDSTFQPSGVNGHGWSQTAWVYQTAGQGGMVFAMDDTHHAYYIYVDTAEIQFITYNNGSGCASGAYGNIDDLTHNITQGAWNLVGITTLANGTGTLSRQRLWLNAAKIDELTSFTGTLCTTSFTSFIGQRAEGSHNLYTGLIDEVSFFTDAGDGTAELTQAQFTTIYNAGITVPTVLHHRFFQTRLPQLPRFRDNDYFLRAVQYGYVTGDFAASERIPLLLPIGYLPLDVAPAGNIGRVKHLSASTSAPQMPRLNSLFGQHAQAIGLLQ